MYFIPLAMLLQNDGTEAAGATITWAGFAANLVPVVLGNLVGGSVLVGLVYYLIYRRPRQ
jgi:formate/nitrite transporter FocA (FNT family)